MPSIAVLPGDGIGPEVIDAALSVLTFLKEQDALDVHYTIGLIGGAAIDATGDPFPPQTQALVSGQDAVLLGAVGGPRWAQADKTPEQGLLRLRQSLGLFANIRPFTVLPGLEAISPLKRSFSGGVIVRELLGGLYFGTPRGRENGEAVDTARYRPDEIERIGRVGFELARRQGCPLMSVDKANVLETSKLWRETLIALKEREYPDVPLHHRYVDAAAMEMVLAPDHFAVVVTENLFGDILSDLGGGLVGSLGLLGSATVAGVNQGRGLYEPVHGSAPDIAGRGVANPIGALQSLAMMLEWSLGLPRVAASVREAIGEVTRQGVVTPDVGGTASTVEVTQAVLERLGPSLANRR